MLLAALPCQAVLSLVTDALELEAVCSSATVPCGAFSAASADGSSGAAIGAARSGAVHWLSASALANRAAGFGTSRLLGFVEGDRDVPHFALEHVLAGDRVSWGAWQMMLAARAQTQFELHP